MIEVRIILNGAQEIQLGLARLRDALQSGSSRRVGRRIAQFAQREVSKLTPRQRNRAGRQFGSTSRSKVAGRALGPLYKSWKIDERIASRSDYLAVVYNTAARDTSDKLGRGGGLAVLASLEWGARPHDISPRGDYMLRWLEQGTRRRHLVRTGTRASPVGEVRDLFERVGARGEVRATRVQHPGTQPFRMVQTARELTRQYAEQALLQYAEELRQKFAVGVR